MSMTHFENMNGRKVLTVDGKPSFLLAGEIHNSNSSAMEAMRTSWDRADALGITTLLIPVTWEMIEPEEDKFDFDLVRELVLEARRRNGHLGILWFGAWKNSQCMYAPEWVKKDRARFKRAQMKKGMDRITLDSFYGLPYSTLSYLCEETKRADAKAFCRFMEWLKDFDEKEQTVLYIQVENETGVMGAPRELSDEADALFNGPAPQGLIEYLRANTAEMEAELKKDIEENAGKEGPLTWTEAFGNSAEEIFSVYYTAGYCEYVASQGKKIYDLPMAVNAWLRQGPPGSYPTGGPIWQMMEVWQYAAPSIEVFCPDIYVRNFLEVCDNYVKRGNPLFIPETACNGRVGARLVYSIGHYHAACFAPFGFEDMGNAEKNPAMALFGADPSDPLLNESQDIAEYRQYSDILASMADRLVAAYGTKNLQAVTSERPEEAEMDFGEIRFTAMTQLPMIEKKDGVCLVLKESSECYYILINRAMLDYASGDETKPNAELLSLDEGRFEDGRWVTTLHRNGDEAQSLMFMKPTLLRCRLFTY